MSEFLTMVLEVLVPIVGSATAWLLGQAARLVQAKIKQSYVQGTLVRLTVAVADAVRAVEQTLVKELRHAQAPGSPGGTKITADEALAIKQAAVAQVKLFLGPKGLAELAKVFGLNAETVDHFLGQKIEAEVSRMKRPT